MIPIIIVGVIAAVSGIGLAIASVVMAVPQDERADAVLEVLPGANCGACGYSGCPGYAAALAEGGAANGLCTPGGNAVAKKISRVLGIAPVNVVRKAAVVHCLGTYDNTSDRIEYSGVHSCAAAMQLFGGVANCSFGCVGLGDCASACPEGAIAVCNGVASVRPERCTGCGICASKCPKGIISVIPASAATVHCSSRIRGNETRKVCKAGCLGCQKCTKVCKTGAITVTDFCASIDHEKCTRCGECVELCPANIIIMR